MSQRGIPNYKIQVRALRAFVDNLVDGDEPDEDFVPGWRVPREPGMDFHKPTRRNIPLRTEDGRGTCYFSHRSVVRVRSGTFVDGHFLKPGSAQAHNRYIERDSAVAVAREEIYAPDQQIRFYEETDSDLQPYANHVLARQLVTKSGLRRADLFSPEQNTAGHRLLSLPGVGLASGGWKADLLLRDLEQEGDLFGATADEDAGLRGEADRPRGMEKGRGREAEAAGEPVKRPSGRAGRAAAVDHLRYIERGHAVARTPDGGPVIVTNIDDDPDERLAFWQAVEDSEATPSSDKMSLDISRAPTFWAAVAAHPSCPSALRDALLADTEAARTKFEIPSGQEMREFLSGIPGWAGKQKKSRDDAADDDETSEPLAKFHDGRGGRIQYRLILELPAELSFAGKVRVIKRFGYEFEARKLPFVAVIHAPDPLSESTQWHSHLNYYDRPAWRLTEEEVAGEIAIGNRPVGEGVGEWNFAAEFRRKGEKRTNRPGLVEKIDEARRGDWIFHLRSRFAFAANEELKREGFYPRFDPRKYSEMGIEAAGGEHLGNKLNAAERKGVATEKGSANEQKQFDAINRQLARKRTATRKAIRAAASALRQRLARIEIATTDAVLIEQQIVQYERTARAAADAEDARERAFHHAARVSSRAAKLRDAHQRALDADVAGTRVLNQDLRNEHTRLRDAATRYIDGLKPFLEEAKRIIDACDTAHSDALRKSQAAERLAQTLLSEADVRARTAPRAIPLAPSIPVIQVEPSVAAAPPPPPHTEQQKVRDWLIRFDKDPRIILSDTTGFHLDPNKPDALIAQPTLQAALRERHAVQERRVDLLVTMVTERRRYLTREQDGWHFRSKNPVVVDAFRSLREHPKLQAAVAAVTGALALPPSKPMPVQTRPVQPGKPAAIASNAGIPTHRGVSSPAPTPAQKPPVITGAEAMPHPHPPTPPAPTVSQRPVASQAQDLARAVSSLALPVARTSTPDPASPERRSAPVLAPPQTRSNIQKILGSKARLAIAADGGIDVDALRRQGHAITLSERKDARLLGLARKQTEHARIAVANFVAKAPGFIVEREDRLLLSEKATPAMRNFVRYHDDDEMQRVLRRGLASRGAAAAAEDAGPAAPVRSSAPSSTQVPARPHVPTPAPPPVLVEAPPKPRLVEITSDDSMVAAAMAYKAERLRRAGLAGNLSDADFDRQTPGYQPADDPGLANRKTDDADLAKAAARRAAIEAQLRGR